MDTKVAIILQAGAESHEGMARMYHSLLYTKELRERGGDVRLVFDGAGTEWAARLHQPDGDERLQRLAGLFGELKEDGLTYEVCDYCSGAFGVKEQLQQTEAPLTAQYMDHPSIASLVEEGYRIWIL